MLYIFLIVRVIERGRYNRAARLGDRSSRDRGNPATAPTGPFLRTNLWKIEFSPRLPVERLKRFQSFPMGNVIKTVLQFERTWWRELGCSGQILNPGGQFSSVVDTSHPHAKTETLTAFTAGAAVHALRPEERQPPAPGSQHFSAGLNAPFNIIFQVFSMPTRTTGPTNLLRLGAYASCRGIGGWKNGHSSLNKRSFRQMPTHLAARS